MTNVKVLNCQAQILIQNVVGLLFINDTNTITATTVSHRQTDRRKYKFEHTQTSSGCDVHIYPDLSTTVYSFMFQQFIILRSYKNKLGKVDMTEEYWCFLSLLCDNVENQTAYETEMFYVKQIIMCFNYLSVL